MPRRHCLMSALALGFSLVFAAPGIAQTTLTLPPPSSAPATGDVPAAKPQAAKKPRTTQKRTAKPKTEDALALPGATKRGNPVPLEVTASKPRRFVPDEFDNGDDSNPGSPRPFMSETGHAGLGMRF